MSPYVLRIFAKSMSATEESDVSLKDVFSTILNWRTAEQVDVLLEKLLREGIKEPRHLKDWSQERIDQKLAGKPHFRLGDISDFVGVLDVIAKSIRNFDKLQGGKKGLGKAYGRRRHHDRSRSRSGGHHIGIVTKMPSAAAGGRSGRKATNAEEVETEF